MPERAFAWETAAGSWEGDRYVVTVALLLYDREYHHFGAVVDRHLFGNGDGPLADSGVRVETTPGRKEEDGNGVFWRPGALYLEGERAAMGQLSWNLGPVQAAFEEAAREGKAYAAREQQWADDQGVRLLQAIRSRT